MPGAGCPARRPLSRGGSWSQKRVGQQIRRGGARENPVYRLYAMTKPVAGA